MKEWSHLVYCNETQPTYGKYLVKAVLIKGKWRLAERNLVNMKYGQILTNVTIKEPRA